MGTVNSLAETQVVRPGQTLAIEESRNLVSTKCTTKDQMSTLGALGLRAIEPTNRLSSTDRSQCRFLKSSEREILRACLLPISRRIISQQVHTRSSQSFGGQADAG